MRQIAQKPMFYNKKKMRALPSTRPAVAATRGQAPLTPTVPFRQSFLEEENLVFGQIVIL